TAALCRRPRGRAGVAVLDCRAVLPRRSTIVLSWRHRRIRGVDIRRGQTPPALYRGPALQFGTLCPVRGSRTRRRLEIRPKRPPGVSGGGGRFRKLLMPARPDRPAVTAIADLSGLNACIVCGGRSERSHLPGLARCSACGMVSAQSDLSDADLERLYGVDYFYGNEYPASIADPASLHLPFPHRSP